MSAAPLQPDLPKRSGGPLPEGDRRAARRELLAIQKRLWRRLNREIEASIEENPPNVDIYQEEYARDLRRYEAPSSKAELVEAASQADLVYVGDYHTLPQSQRTLVKLLLALTRIRPEVVLCMEVVHADQQDDLDRYMAERLPEEEFLRRIDYERSWGFPWPPYREVLAVARSRGVRVVGINSDPRDHDQDHLIERDFRAAEVIVREVRASPEALVVVFDGDLHVARDHLPMIVSTVLEREGLGERRGVIVHQNAEEIYWRLAREAREEDVNVLRLAEDAFCVLNASPFEKLHSYLNWVTERESLEPPVGSSSWDLGEELGLDDDDDDDDVEDVIMSDLGAEYAEQVHQIVETVARFLEIERDDLDAFELFTVNDLDFLAYLDSGGLFTEAEREDIKRQILSNESYFIPKANIIYLSDFSVVNAAEEGTHFLHHLCSGYRWDRPRDLVTDFYFRAATEALGFFGSKLIVPTRETWTARDCAAFVEHHRARERERARLRRRGHVRPASGHAAALDASPEEAPETSSTERVTILHGHRRVLRASRLVLRHKEIERDWLETGHWRSAGALLTQPAELHLLVTHMLGHMLGEKLYLALVAGHVDKAEVARLFHENLDKRGVALRLYQRMLRLVRGVTHDPVRSERL